MPENPIFPEPPQVADAVEVFIDSEHEGARRYSNRSVLDASGCYSLHRLAGRIYADGWGQGHIVGRDQARRTARREADAHRAELEKSLPIALDYHQRTESGCRCETELSDGEYTTWQTHLSRVLLSLALP